MKNKEKRKKINKKKNKKKTNEIIENFDNYFKKIKETRKKLINHCIIPNKKITIIFHQKKFKCKECNHTFMEFNPIGDGISNLAIAEIINSLYIWMIFPSRRRKQNISISRQ